MLRHLRLCHSWAQRLPTGGSGSLFIACLMRLITRCFLHCMVHRFHFSGRVPPFWGTFPSGRPCLHHGRACAQRPRCFVCVGSGPTDPGQVSAVSRALPAQMGSSLIASIGASFAATDAPGPSSSTPDQPWLASGTLHSSTPEADNVPNVEEPKQDDPWHPPQTGDTSHSEQTQMLRGHPVRKVLRSSNTWRR